MRKRMRRICFCFGLLLALSLVVWPTGAAADDGLREAEIRAAVETWVRHVTADARPGAVVERMEPHRVAGETVAYIAHLQGGGFCLAGADIRVLPVYFYSPHGTYDPSNPGYQYVLWEIGARLEAIRHRLRLDRPDAVRPDFVLRASLAVRADFWRDLTARRVPERGREVRMMADEDQPPEQMVLPLTTTWHQRAPYNDLCPMGDGGRSVVGCVATASAQIMKYWEWPPAAVDIEPYWWDGDTSCGGSTSGDTLPPTVTDAYDWRNMPDNCDSGCSTAEQTALAQLSYDVGVALQMNYGFCGSGADSGRVQTVLTDFFRYDEDATYEARDPDTMVEEIQWLRPFHFRGANPDDGGHAWVVYGYNSSTDPDQFLMNLGWGGAQDGWYSVDSVPEDFTAGQRHTTRIAPADAVRFVGSTDSGDGSPGSPYRDIQEGLDNADHGAILIFKAGSVNTFSGGPLVIDRPVTLRGSNVTIRRED